jgi:hypothetical protein
MKRKTYGLARGLGWFSVGLGLVELLAPRRLGRALGMEDRTGLLRFYGVRELTAGLGILTQARQRPWIWARVAGDALDLATLAWAFSRREDKRGNVAFATANVAAVTALDVYTGRALAW